MKLGVYPGTFDPITYGHLDVLRRALKIFDRVLVLVAKHPEKRTLFTAEERLKMVEEVIKNVEGADADKYCGLLVDYLKDKNATAVIRGMRVVSDFEYEFQMALMNRRLDKSVQTVFLMTGLRWIFTSSSIIKEAARYGGNVESMVPAVVRKRLAEKFGLDIKSS